MLNSIVKIIRGIIRIRGASDNTLIGNVNDRLKVTNSSSPNNNPVIYAPVPNSSNTISPAASNTS